MRVGGPGISFDRRGKLTIDEEGELAVGASYGGSEQVNFADGWSSILKRGDVAHLLRLCGVALETAVDPDLDRPLSRRFLDASHWFGEAVREKSPAAKAVKFVTALERMVMTEEKDDITRLVSERVSALCFDPTEAGSLDIWRADAQRVYSLRSKLVHGAMSPHEKGINAGVILAAKLGEVTLLSAINTYSDKGLRDESINVRKLGDWYDAMVAWANRAIEERSVLDKGDTGDSKG
jgi:hypothetical protein